MRGGETIPPLFDHRPWMRTAPCVGLTPLFFPCDGAHADQAKAICATCDHRAECLDAALETNEKQGIWGGLSPKERRLVARQRNANGRVRSTRIAHGTYGGYLQCFRRDEGACAYCLDAHARYREGLKMWKDQEGAA